MIKGNIVPIQITNSKINLEKKERKKIRFCVFRLNSSESDSVHFQLYKLNLLYSHGTRPLVESHIVNVIAKL